MSIGYPLKFWNVFEMAIDMIYHFVGSSTNPHPVIVSASIISDIYNALGFLTNDGEKVLA